MAAQSVQPRLSVEYYNICYYVNLRFTSKYKQIALLYHESMVIRVALWPSSFTLFLIYIAVTVCRQLKSKKKVHFKKQKAFKVHYYNMSSGSISIDITITIKQKIEIQPK